MMIKVEEISIHAPLTGCDGKGLSTNDYTTAISIHAPLTGCDTSLNALSNEIDISIHAPLTGCDCNPSSQISVPSQISIHAPLTGCDAIILREICIDGVFQSTHPLRDATDSTLTPLTIAFNFNPRTPYGMRRRVNVESQRVSAISIHAPLTGCDRKG